jgi:hypothetical protein
MLFRVGIPDGVVDPALGFTDGPIEYTPLVRATSHRDLSTQNPAGDFYSRFLDFIHQYDNQGYTGGVPIFPPSIIVRDPADNGAYDRRRMPGIGQVNMDGISPGKLSFAGEDWIVFPLKQKGTYEAMNGGTNPQPINNSLNLGIAIKKA